MLSPSFAVSLGCERRIVTWQDVQDICRGDMEERWLLALHKIVKEKFGISDGLKMSLFSKNLAGKLVDFTPL